MSVYASKVESGSGEVIASGTVIPYPNQPFTITFGSSTEELVLICKFVHEENAQAGMRGKTLDEHTLELTFTNTDNVPTGAGTGAPLPIGVLDGKQIYLLMAVYTPSPVQRVVHYTIYRAKEAS